MNIYKDHLHPAIAWGIIALGVILIGLLVFLSYQSTSDELSAAQQAEQAAPSTAPFLPRSYSVNGDKWFVIKSDEYTLSEWGISMRIPFQYPKTIAATYVKDENAYYFADIKTLSNRECRERFYKQIRAMRPGLKVQRINGFDTTIPVAGSTQTVDDYYAKNQIADTNYAVFPNDIGSERRVYKVGQYFYYDLSELPSEKLDETSQNQRALFCGDAKILEADEIFISSISTFKLN